MRSTVLQVIAGPDPDDPVTVADTPIARDFSPGGRPAAIPDYAAALQKDGLKGARIGVLRQAYERDTTDAEIVKVFMAALEDMKRAGAVIVDPVRVDLDQIRRQQGAGTCGGFKYDINRYLAAHGDRVPVQEPRRDHPVAAVPSVGAAAARAGAGRHRERAGHAGVQGRGGRIASRCAPRC